VEVFELVIDFQNADIVGSIGTDRG
jgi:hypothetical protein